MCVFRLNTGAFSLVLFLLKLCRADLQGDLKASAQDVFQHTLGNDGVITCSSPDTAQHIQNLITCFS